MARWFRICFEHAKTHLVSQTHKLMLVEEMLQRGSPLTNFIREYQDLDPTELTNPKEVTQWGLDMPGMINVNRPVETFKWASLMMEIPCEDIHSFWSELRRLEPRRFEGAITSKAVYYKLHGHRQCVVMTSKQKDRLIELLNERRESAEAKTTTFYRQQHDRLEQWGVAPMREMN